jgi:outer membrane lipoprotein SlyB
MKIATMRYWGIALAGTALIVGGCATYQPYPVYREAPVVSQRTEYGVVESINVYRGGSTSPINVGTILGGIVGGVLGHQIGGGTGNTVATIAGAVGGAAVGNELNRQSNSDRYRVVVRLDSGGTITLADVASTELRVCDRVKVVDNRVYRE